MRLSIYPDGGWPGCGSTGSPYLIPLSWTELSTWPRSRTAASSLGCSDAFYSSAANLIMPGRAASMADGWENARRRDGGLDYATIALAGAGLIRQVEIDTAYFVGNAPGWARLLTAADTANVDWRELLPRTRLQPDTRHQFLVVTAQPATHARLEVYPDGGLARLRVLGEIVPEALARLRERYASVVPGDATRGAAVP